MTVFSPIFTGDSVMSERDCAACWRPIDADGVTTGDCPVSSPEVCDSCGGCYCDGRC